MESKLGYEVHVTCKANWHDDEGPVIELEEWQRLIQEDPELDKYDDVGPEDIGKVASYGDEIGMLLWTNGEVQSKNPERSLRAKMFQIAKSLNAKVQGDDGEVYIEDGTSPELENHVRKHSSSFFGTIFSWFQSKKP